MMTVNNLFLSYRNTTLLKTYTRALDKATALTARYKTVIEEKDRLQKPPATEYD